MFLYTEKKLYNLFIIKKHFLDSENVCLFLIIDIKIVKTIKIILHK